MATEHLCQGFSLSGCDLDLILDDGSPVKRWSVAIEFEGSLLPQEIIKLFGFSLLLLLENNLMI